MPFDVTEGGKLGPISRVVFNTIWTKMLFVKGSAVYLPEIIKNGDESRGLQSYDPIFIEDRQPPIGLPVDQNTRSTACMSIQYPVVPVGNGEPTLSFSNLKIINLHAMKNIESLDFLEGFRVQGKVEVGNLDGVALPLTILPIQDSPAGDRPDNYEFLQPCCVPKTSGTKKCGSNDECQKSFVNRGTGGLTAKIKKIIGTGTLVVDPDEMKVTECESFVVSIDPIDVSIDFTVNEGGGDMGKEGMEAFAKAAVATGVANNYIESTINGFFAQESFKEHIVKAVNAALESLP